jgi:hypothetical protein
MDVYMQAPVIMSPPGLCAANAVGYVIKLHDSVDWSCLATADTLLAAIDCLVAWLDVEQGATAKGQARPLDAELVEYTLPEALNILCKFRMVPDPAFRGSIAAGLLEEKRLLLWFGYLAKAQSCELAASAMVAMTNAAEAMAPPDAEGQAVLAHLMVSAPAAAEVTSSSALVWRNTR